MDEDSDLHIVLFTAGCAALATLLIIPPGLLMAWWFTRSRWPGKAVVETIVLLPLVMPPLATGLILLQILGRRGWLGQLFFQAHMPIVFSWRAVVIASAVMSFPLFLRSVRTSWAELDPAMEETAAMLGAGPWRVFRTITLPLIARSIIAGALLAFARALGEFGATVMLAGNIPGQTTTLSLAIYTDILLGDDDGAYRLLGYLVGLALVAVVAGEWLLRRVPSRGS
jgi:molybdate transport system permease protein